MTRPRDGFVQGQARTIWYLGPGGASRFWQVGDPQHEAEEVTWICLLLGPVTRGPRQQAKVRAPREISCLP